MVKTDQICFPVFASSAISLPSQCGEYFPIVVAYASALCPSGFAVFADMFGNLRIKGPNRRAIRSIHGTYTVSSAGEI
jgi:hypothetical protein